MSVSNENAVRKASYKNNGKDLQESRKKRADVSVELRKARKDDQLMKRRNMGNLDSSGDEISPLKERNVNRVIPMMSLSQAIASMLTDDSTRQLEGVTSVRRILSKEDAAPIDDVIRANILPRLVEFLSSSHSSQIQFESAWALTNVASGTSDQTMCVVKEGAIVPLVTLLTSASPMVVEQAVWALSNIIGEGPEQRQAVIKAGIVSPLLSLVNGNVELGLMKTVVWALSNVCRSKPTSPDPAVVEMILPCLKQLLHHTDGAILADTCWALNHIADGDTDNIDLLVNSGCVQKLVELLYSPNQAVVTPSLRAVGNVVTGTDLQTQFVLDCPGALSAMQTLLKHSKPAFRKEAAWALSNIAAGSREQVQALIVAGVIPDAIELMKSADFKTAKEALWLVTNATASCNVEQVSYIVAHGAIQALCGMLGIGDSKLLVIIMDGLKNILETAKAADEEAMNKLVVVIEECGGLDRLEICQQHDNEEVYKAAFHLIDTYFGEDENEVENLVPTTGADETEFAFGSAVGADGAPAGPSGLNGGGIQF